MKIAKAPLFLFLIAILCVSVSAQRYIITEEEMMKNGISVYGYEPINLSHDGSYFAGLQVVTDLDKKAQGITRTLKVIYFNGKKIDKVLSADIPITHRVNAAVSDKKDEIVILGDYGTKVVRARIINDSKIDVKVIFQHRKGRPGYKMEDFLFAHDGKFFATSWRYDKSQIWQGDYVVEISTKGKKARFGRRLDIKKSIEQYRPHTNGFARTLYYVSGDTVYFNWVDIEIDKTHLVALRNRKHSIVDTARIIGIFCGNKDRVYYQKKATDDAKETYHLKDLKSGKDWKIGFPDAGFTYPFLSGDGKRLIVCTFNYRRKVTNAFLCEEKNNFRLSRFLRDAPIGAMKFSKDGKTYAILIQGKGLMYQKFVK